MPSWIDEVLESAPKQTEPVKPEYQYARTKVTPGTSSVDMADFKGYTGNQILTGDEGNDIANLQEMRARNQSGFSQAVNSIGKFGIYAGTTFIDGVAGTLFGLGNLVTGGEDSSTQFSDFWNNPLSNAMSDVQQWSESAMPNYKTAAELDAPFWQRMFGLAPGAINFWGDTVFKNLGFTVGALGAASLGIGAVGEGMLLTNATKGLAKNSLGRVAKQLGKSEAEVARLIQTGKMDISSLSGQLIKDAKQVRALNGIQQAHGAIMSALGEARFEAINGARDYYNKTKAKLMEAGIGEDEADLAAAKESLGVGNSIFGMNVALLSMGNYQQFKSLFNPGYRAQSKSITGLALKDGKYTLEKLGKFDRAKRLLVNPFLEGGEEMSQLAIEAGSKSYHERINDPETTNAINAYTGAFMDGMRKAFSEEGFENFFAGFFTGAVGMPNIAEAIRSGDGKKALSAWSGGIAEQVRTLRNEQAKGSQAVEKLNSILGGKEFQSGYMNLAAAMTAEKAKQAAIAKNDEVAYEIANNNQFHATVSQFLDSGKLDDLDEMLTEQANKNGETLRAEWIVNNENGEQVDSFKHMTNPQLEEYNRQRVEQQKKLVQTIAQFNDDIETKTRGQVSEPFKKTLTELLTKAHFSQVKGEELRTRLLDKLGKWKQGKGIDTPTVFELKSEKGAVRINEAKGKKLEDPKSDIERAYNDLLAYRDDTLDADVAVEFRDWSRYQTIRQEAVDMYQQIMKDPAKYEKKFYEQQEQKIAEELDKQIESKPDEPKQFKSTGEILDTIKANRFRMKDGVVQEDVPIAFFDEEGKKLGKGVITKYQKQDGTWDNQVILDGVEKPVKLSALTEHKGTVRIATLEEKITVRRRNRQKVKTAILKRMAEQSEKHNDVIQRGIEREQEKLAQLKSKRDEVLGLLKLANEEILTPQLEELVNSAQAELDAVTGKINTVQGHLDSLLERKQMLIAYRQQLEEELVEAQLDADYNVGQKISSLEETLTSDQERFQQLPAFGDIAALDSALSTINGEITVAESQLVSLVQHRNLLARLVNELGAELEKFKNRDNLLEELRKLIPGFPFESGYASTALIDYLLGRAPLAKLNKWMEENKYPDASWMDQLATFKNNLNRLGQEKEKYQIDLDSTRANINSLRAVYEDMIKTKSYFEAFGKLQNLYLIRKGYETTALNTGLDRAIEAEEKDSVSLPAQEEASSEEPVANYSKDEVSANTYLHVDYDNTGGQYFDVQETVVVNGKFYTMPSFVTNKWQKAYGDWMSEVTDIGKYELKLVTMESANEKQQEAIRGFNPSQIGTDQVYVFVAEKATGTFVEHNGAMLVSTILDSMRNSKGGKRFSIEKAYKFFVDNGANISYQDKSDKAFWFKVDGNISEFKISDYKGAEDARKAFEDAFYSAMEIQYVGLKQSLYQELKSAPQIRSITSISNGFVSKVKEKDAYFEPREIFKAEDLAKSTLRISTGVKTDSRFLPGVPVLTLPGNREVGMRIRNMNEEEADFVFEVLKKYGKEIGIDDDDKRTKINGIPIMPPKIKKGSRKPTESVLTNYLNFGTVRNKETKKIDRNADQIFGTKAGKIVIITRMNLGTGTYNQHYEGHEFDIEELEANKDKVKNYLKSKRRNIISSKLEDSKKEGIDYSFNANREIIGKASGIPYKDYLLDNVLKTNVIPHTEGAQFAQRYFGFPWKQEQAKIDVPSQVDYDPDDYDIDSAVAFTAGGLQEAMASAKSTANTDISSSEEIVSVDDGGEGGKSSPPSVTDANLSDFMAVESIQSKDNFIQERSIDDVDVKVTPSRDFRKRNPSKTLEELVKAGVVEQECT